MCLLLLNTESKLTGLCFHPVVTELTSSYRPAIRATWPGRDSVGTRVCETPNVPCSSTRDRRKGANGRGLDASEGLVPGGGDGSGCDWKALSALRPSPIVEYRISDKVVCQVYV